MPLAQLEIQPAMIEQVEERLLDAIVDGGLTPGQRLTQESVAAMFGVSRQPVSHALQALKRRGLVVEHGKRGLAVAVLDGQRIRDLYQVRAALDSLAAERAAAVVKAGTADMGLLDRCQAAVTAGERLGVQAPLREFVQLDVRFHTAIYELAGNTAIVEMVAEQWPHFMRSMRLVLAHGIARTRVWKEHADIMQAVLAGDARKAAALARQHTLGAGEETAERLEVASVSCIQV